MSCNSYICIHDFFSLLEFLLSSFYFSIYTAISFKYIFSLVATASIDVVLVSSTLIIISNTIDSFRTAIMLFLSSMSITGFYR